MKDGSDMLNRARTTCIICGSPQLQPLLNLSAVGVPHGVAGHNFTYEYQLIAICGACGHGQLEKYSHDCYPHYEDEDWEMYWWYALGPVEVLRLRALLTDCPDALNAACQCALHRSLRESGHRLWGGVRHVVSPERKTGFAWLALDEQPDRVALKVDQQKGIGQAA
jgi:hypothetical protein